MIWTMPREAEGVGAGETVTAGVDDASVVEVDVGGEDLSLVKGQREHSWQQLHREGHLSKSVLCRFLSW